jgi:C-terminal processing protease CtpA/Prc
MFGLGLWFELRTDSAYITRTLDGSPAARAGIVRGDQVVRIAGREVSAMSADEIRSAFNSVPSAGLPLVLSHQDGTNLSVTLREGPIYPTFEQVGALD